MASRPGRRFGGGRVPLALTAVAVGLLAAAGGVELSRVLAHDDARPTRAPSVVRATLPPTTQTTTVAGTTAPAVPPLQATSTAAESTPPEDKGKGHEKKPHSHGGDDD